MHSYRTVVNTCFEEIEYSQHKDYGGLESDLLSINPMDSHHHGDVKPLDSHHHEDWHVTVSISW